MRSSLIVLKNIWFSSHHCRSLPIFRLRMQSQDSALADAHSSSPISQPSGEVRSVCGSLLGWGQRRAAADWPVDVFVRKGTLHWLRASCKLRASKDHVGGQLESQRSLCGPLSLERPCGCFLPLCSHLFDKDCESS